MSAIVDELLHKFTLPIIYLALFALYALHKFHRIICGIVFDGLRDHMLAKVHLRHITALLV